MTCHYLEIRGLLGEHVTGSWKTTSQICHDLARDLRGVGLAQVRRQLGWYESRRDTEGLEWRVVAPVYCDPPGCVPGADGAGDCPGHYMPPRARRVNGDTSPGAGGAK